MSGMDGLLLLPQYVVMDSPFNDTALTGLVAGRDYPRTYREFTEMFPDDAACAAWLGQHGLSAKTLEKGLRDTLN